MALERAGVRGCCYVVGCSSLALQQEMDPPLETVELESSAAAVVGHPEDQDVDLD